MIIAVFLVIRPFLLAITTSVILAYIFRPMYIFLHSKIKNRNAAAIITTLVIVLLISIPLLFAINSLAQETRINYLVIRQKVISFTDCEGEDCVNPIASILSNPRISYYIQTGLDKVTAHMADIVSDIVFSIPKMLFNLVVSLFIIFYILRDGAAVFERLEKLSPLGKHHYQRILKKFDQTVHAVVFGYIILAIIEGILSAIVLYALGVRAPILLGTLIALFGILPIAGPPVVWLPIALFMIAEGSAAASSLLITKGVILIIFGIVIGVIIFFLKPKIIGDRAQIHPILVLLGVLGGIAMFGFPGIIIGPITLAVFTTFLQIYEKEKGGLFK